MAEHRGAKWPSPAALPAELANIYSKVKASGLPNGLGARMQVPSKLNTSEWEKVFNQNPKYDEMLDFIKYGFPMGYLGPISHYDKSYNHTSADNFPRQIEDFISKEIDLGGRDRTHETEAF